MSTSATLAGVSVPTAGPVVHGQADTPKPDLELRRRQKALTALGRRAIAPPAAPIFVEDAAALVAETLEAEFFGVTEVLPDGRTLLHKLHETNQEDGKPLENHSENSESISMAGFTLAMAHPVSCTDLSVEKKFQDTFLRKSGIVSALCSPLRLLDRSFGAISVFSTTRREFSPDDIQFIETIAHLVTATVARDRAERALADQQQLQAAVLENVEALVVVMNEDGKIQKLNRSCREISGFDTSSLPDRPMWDLFFLPDEAEGAHDVFRKALSAKEPLEHEAYLLTKKGERRRICWSFAAVRNSENRLLSTIASGLDVTELREQRDELTKAQAAAAESARTISELLKKTNATEVQRADAGQAAGAEQPFREIPIGPKGERRVRPRRSYPYKQLIAPMTENGLPDRNTFYEVECRDIGAGGFSYLSTTPPGRDTLVVALGTAPSLTYLTAQVAHMTSVERNGERWHLIGCRYTGRAAYTDN